MDLIPAYFYRSAYNILMAILVVAASMQLRSLPNNSILNRPNSSSDFNSALLLSIILILFFGLRDPISEYFADSAGYAARYFVIESTGKSTIWYTLISESSEFIWNNILLFFALNKLGISLWFTFIAAIYILGNMLAVNRIFPNNVYLGCLFAFLNFGFFSGAVNGIRNAAALALILVALSLIIKKKKINLASIILIVVGFNIHNSVILPAICIITSFLFIKDISVSIKIWCLSIVLSLIAGNTISSMFAGLGFDDRLASYIDSAKNSTHWNRFRWDFVLFSVVPIIWGWFVIKKMRFNDKVYSLIYNTYVLTNSFWIMVIRAAFTNRFAMLSWAFYFLVIAYPLLKFNIYEDQGAKISFALFFMLMINFFI